MTHVSLESASLTVPGGCVNNKLLHAMALFWLVILSSVTQAEGVEFSGSGFMTLAAGKILGGTSHQTVSGYQCPCFISDYANAGIYENNGINIGPDSKLGLQGTATFNKDFSATGQVVSRGARNGRVNLEWVYGSYKLNDTLTLQVGRKRLPLFYYSESQDVGLSFPWAHLPPQLYGWEIVNYNGANVLYQDQWGEWSSSLNVFAGDETRNDTGYWKIYNGKDTHTDSRWSNIRGAELGLSRDWLETRLVYIESDVQNKVVGVDADFSPKAKQQIYGLSANIDHEKWVVRTEFLYIDHKEDGGTDRAQLFGIGYRISKFLPMITYANYQETVAADQNRAEGHSTTSLSVRYDVNTSSAIKVQYDYWKDHSGPIYNTWTPYGSSRLLSVSYDMVF